MTLIADAAPLVAMGDAADPRLPEIAAVLAAERGEIILLAPISAEVDYLAPVDESTPGSVTLVVTKANHAGAPFVGQTLTFVVDSTTQVKLKGGAVVDGDKGQVQVKGAPGLDATGLQALTPKLVVDQTG